MIGNTEADREKIWDQSLEPYIHCSEFGFSKSTIRLVRDIYFGKLTINHEHKDVIELFNRGGYSLLFFCQEKRDERSWDDFFNCTLKNWFDTRYPVTEGKDNLKERDKKLNNIASSIDPMRTTFRPWQYGWSDEEDIAYFQYWYGSKPGEFNLPIPSDWIECFSRGHNQRFIDLCYGVCSYLEGRHRFGGRYSLLYPYLRKCLSEIDSSIFVPDSFLGKGLSADVKTALASLLHSVQQREYVIEKFEGTYDRDKFELPRFPPETRNLSGTDMWECEPIKVLREIIIQDLCSGNFPESIQMLGRFTSYPDISVHFCLTKPTEKKHIKYHDPWSSPKDKIILNSE